MIVIQWLFTNIVIILILVFFYWPAVTNFKNSGFQETLFAISLVQCMVVCNQEIHEFWLLANGMGTRPKGNRRFEQITGCRNEIIYFICVLRKEIQYQSV